MEALLDLLAVAVYEDGHGKLDPKAPRGRARLFEQVVPRGRLAFGAIDVRLALGREYAGVECELYLIAVLIGDDRELSVADDCVERGGVWVGHTVCMRGRGAGFI